MKTTLVILLAITIGCSAVPDGAYGEVYDLTTRQPIEGAQLIVHRTGKGSRTEVATQLLYSGDKGLFNIGKETGTRISHVTAEAGGYYRSVGVRRGRIYLRPVPPGARPAQSVSYDVDMGAEDVGVILATGAIVPADEADVVVRVRPTGGPLHRTVLVRARGGLRRLVSRMPHGIALEPFVAFDNIVEVPRKGYSRWHEKGTSSYGWTSYGTYAIRTRDRQRHAKLLVAAFPSGDGKTAQVVVRYGLSAVGETRFVATTP